MAAAAECHRALGRLTFSHFLQTGQRDPNEFSQVILNILNNAKDAFEISNTVNLQVIITTSKEEGTSV